MSTLRPRLYRTAPFGLALLLLGLGLYACPPAVGDDDDLVSPDDDDDDDDDDTGGGDDDDFTIPDGLPIGGNLLWQPSDGEVPAAHVRVGLFHLDGLAAGQSESFGALVSEEGLSGGNTIYTVYLKSDPEPGDMSPIADSSATAAIYAAVAYIDESENGGYDGGELALGVSTSLLAFVEDVIPFPGELSSLGAGPGWNLLDAAFLDGAAMSFLHVPEGTNSSNGPSIETDLLPNTGGTTGVRTEVLVPDGGVVAAWHSSAFAGAPVADYEQFVTAASNEAAPGGTLLAWNIDGEPPSGHIGVLGAPVGDDDDSAGGDDGPELQGAVYEAVVYFDDGDQVFGPGACDTLLAVGDGRTLLWIEPSTLTLEDAFGLQRTGTPLGWSLFDEALDTWRPFAVGIDLLAAAPGDDDDSAGDEDPPSIPPDCLGDDDDSAGDDDDSAGQDSGGT